MRYLIGKILDLFSSSKKFEEDEDGDIRVYDQITDLKRFVKERSIAISNKKEKELYQLLNIVVIFNGLLQRLPNRYHTRDGHEIEEFEGQTHSSHDAARILGSLIVREYNEIIADITIGSYKSAIRSNRAVFEWIVRSVSTLSNLFVMSGDEAHKGIPGCFEALLMSYMITQLKNKVGRNNDDELLKMIQKKIDEEGFDPMLYDLVETDIGFGVRKFITGLNESISTIIQIPRTNGEGFLTGKDALLEIYSLLSENVHMDTEKVFEILPGGMDKFVNYDEFDKTYSLLISVTDVILTLFIILIDTDIFHSDDKWKLKWRKEVSELYKEFPVKFFSTKNLIESQIWNSNPPQEFCQYRAI